MAPLGIPDWAVGLLWAIIAVIVGVGVGAIVDVAVVGRLRRYAAGRSWHLRRSVVSALRGLPEIWGALIGVALVRPEVFLPFNWSLWVSRLWDVALIVSLTVFTVRLACEFIRSYLTSDQSRGPSGTIFVNITRVAIWAVGLTFVLAALGVQIGPLVTTLGVGGIAISLGLQDTLANLFNGVQISLTRQIETGQYVRLQSGEEGEVVDINWRDTRLKTAAGDVIIVPNSILGRSAMTNYSHGLPTHVVGVPFIVGPGSDVDRVVAIARDVAAEIQASSPEADPEFEPTCRATAFGPEGVTCSASLRVLSYRKRGIVTDKFLRALHKRLAAEAPSA